MKLRKIIEIWRLNLVLENALYLVHREHEKRIHAIAFFTRVCIIMHVTGTTTPKKHQIVFR